MKTLEKLIQENECLAHKIDQNAIAQNVDRVIYGIIDPERYLKAKYRILWILKEPVGGSSWNYSEKFKDKDWIEPLSAQNPTLRKVIYTSYAILNGSEWDEIPYARKEEAFEHLRDIAFVNIKKSPEYNVASDEEIKEAYKQNEQLLQEQINMCDADIVIFGNTLQYFHKELFEGLETAERQNTEYGNAYYDTGKKLYIWTWHPAVRRATDKDYVMDIANIVKQWSER